MKNNIFPHSFFARNLWVATLFILSGCTTTGGNINDNNAHKIPLKDLKTAGQITNITPLDGLSPEQMPLSDHPSVQPADAELAVIDAEVMTHLTPTDRDSADLWVRLRASFELEYSNPDDATVKKFEQWYAGHPQYFQLLSKRAYWYLPYILEQVELRGMPAEVALLPAIESAFKPEAVSRSNAVGMWQFISATGKRFGLRKDWWMDGRQDMVHSTRAALDYLDFLSAEFNHDWELAFAAYNAGEGTIRRALKRNQAANKPKKYPYLNLHKETREYVPRLFAIRNIIMNPEHFGITLPPIPNQHTLAIIDAKTQTDLVVAASFIPMTDAELRKLNLGYKRGITHPSGPHNIVVPVEFSKILADGLDNLDAKKKIRWVRHAVRGGEYLGKIAQNHGVTTEAIMRANRLSSNLIIPGQELKIPISNAHQYALASLNDGENRGGDSLGDRVHKVKKGDSLWKISRLNNISMHDILRWNEISKNATLQPGQQLIVGRYAD